MLVLASASPRRADALRRLGLPFAQRPAAVDEEVEAGVAPAEVVRGLARAKALAAAAEVPEGWVLGADTLVFRDGRAYGKPASAAEAHQILAALQGGWHEVHTALCVVRQPGGKAFERAERAAVRFAPLGPDLIAAYVATGEPMGKAGAYAVQGIAAAYVEEVQGAVDVVVGLPVRPLVHLLARAGYPLPAHLRVAEGAAPVAGPRERA